MLPDGKAFCQSKEMICFNSRDGGVRIQIASCQVRASV